MTYNKCYLISGIGGVLSILLGILLRWNITVIIIVFLVTVTVLATVSYILYESGFTKHKRVIVTEQEINKITITARNPRVVEFINIEAEYNASLDYNPAEIKYSSITLGGITTGTIDFKDESTSMKHYKNGNYFLSYGTNSKNTPNWPVYYIELSDRLVDEAKANPDISYYLKGNTLVLRDTDSKFSKEEVDAFSHFMNDGSLESITKATKILGGSSPRSLLSKDECVKIKKWLSGK